MLQGHAWIPCLEPCKDGRSVRACSMSICEMRGRTRSESAMGLQIRAGDDELCSIDIHPRATRTAASCPTWSPAPAEAGSHAS